MRPINILDLNNAQQDVTHIAEIATSAQATAVDRLGQRKRTISGVVADAALSAETKAGAAMAAIQGVITDATFAVEAAASASMASIGYQPPVAYGAGISITARTQTVSYAGQVFGPNLADIPFTTSGTFESTKFRLISGVTAADLAAASGAALVGNGGESVKESLDALQLPDYAALRAYKGPRKSVYVTGAGIAGMFVRDDTDTVSADNGGTVIVAGSKRWKRVCDAATPGMFGAVSDGAADDAAAVRAAVNSGAKVVDFLGRPTKINSSVTIPAGVSLINMDMRLGTAQINMLLVNSNVSIKGAVTGTGATNGVERAIYPAADGVANVHLNLDVSGFNCAVHAQPLSGDATPDANWPAGWHGELRFKDIPGSGVAGNGYALLLSPAKNCRFKVSGKNINRHVVYLSAGARDNEVDVNIDGVVTSAAVQIYALATQSPCIGNKVTGVIRGLPKNSQGHGVYVGVNAHKNEVDVAVFGGGGTGTFVEGDAATLTWPTDNIVKCRAEGVFTLAPIHQLNGARTKVYPTVHGYTTDVNRGCVNFESTAAFTDMGYAAQVFDAAIDALGNATVGIRSTVQQCPIRLGTGVVRNNGGALKVRLLGTSKKIGSLQRETGQTKISNIAAGATGSVAVVLAGSYEGPRVMPAITKHLPTAGASGSSCWVDNVTATGFTLYIKNGAATAQDITVDWAVEGD